MIQKTKFIIVIVLLLSVLTVSGSALAAGPFSLDRWTVDGGGGVSQASSYTLTGTIGQPDAGVMKGGSYLLSGGFWKGEQVKTETLYLPLPMIMR